jgi:hypothetical protein
VWESPATAISVAAALFTGAVCGCVPLLVGLWRRQIGLGIGGYLICVLSSLAFGLIVAIFVSLFLSAGIIRLTAAQAFGSRIAVDSAAIDNLRRVPFPHWCTWVFVVALLCFLILWPSVRNQINARLYFGVYETLWSVLSDKMGYVWLAVGFGMIANALLLLRYRSADLLGWLSIICWIVAFAWTLASHHGSSSPSAEHVEQAFVKEVILIAGIAGIVVFGTALVRYRLWMAAVDASRGTRPERHRRFGERRSGLGGPDHAGEQFGLPRFMSNARSTVEDSEDPDSRGCASGTQATAVPIGEVSHETSASPRPDPFQAESPMSDVEPTVGRVQVCPKCQVRIIPSKEGECPSCRSIISKPPGTSRAPSSSVDPTIAFEAEPVIYEAELVEFSTPQTQDAPDAFPENPSGDDEPSKLSRGPAPTRFRE